jgi:hypothetical protein
MTQKNRPLNRRPTRAQVESLRAKADREIDALEQKERERDKALSAEDVERLKRSSEAAVAFATKVLGKRR